MAQEYAPDRSSFQAKMPMLHMMLGYLRDRLKELGLHETELLRCEIALEEVLVNIINHAYQGEVGEIDLAYEKQGDFITIIVRDHGIPFNPLEHKKEYDYSAPLEEREIGGLGIIMIKEFMDEIEYKRENEMNVLFLKKRVTSA